MLNGVGLLVNSFVLHRVRLHFELVGHFGEVNARSHGTDSGEQEAVQSADVDERFDDNFLVSRVSVSLFGLFQLVLKASVSLVDQVEHLDSLEPVRVRELEVVNLPVVGQVDHIQQVVVDVLFS